MEILEETVSQQRTVAFWRFFHRFSRLFKCENMCQPSSRSTHFCIGAIFKTPHHYDAQHNNGDWMMACSMLAHFSTKNWQIWLIWTKLSNFLSKFENNGKLYLLYSFSALFSKEISLISRKNWQIWLFWTKIQYLFARIWKKPGKFYLLISFSALFSKDSFFAKTERFCSSGPNYQRFLSKFGKNWNILPISLLQRLIF